MNDSNRTRFEIINLENCIEEPLMSDAFTKKFRLVLWHIKCYCLFNTKFSLYIYIRYIWFVNIS